MAHDDSDLIFRSDKASSSARALADSVFTRNPEPETRNPSSTTRNPSSETPDSIWTLPLLCLGLGIIACCVLLPAADVNRRLVLEREKLNRDLEVVEKQSAVNDEFLKRVSNDPELAERLAQRQMRFVREGTNVLDLPETPRVGGVEQMSPFLLTALPGAAPMAKLPPKPGILGKLSSSSKLQLYAIGGALLLLAIALVTGSSSSPTAVETADK